MTTLTKEQAELRAADRPSGWDSKGTIKEATRSRKGWSITTEGGSGFWLSWEQLGHAKPPKIGDEIVLYTHRGSMIRGVDLRGEPLFYKTQAELDADHAEFAANLHTRRLKEFEKERRKLDRQFAALPVAFQRRVSWFRAWNPDFRWKYEAYELSACVDAVKIAETMKTPKGVDRFQKMSNKRQNETVPGLFQGHSGNSFGMAVRLAALYLRDPLYVIAQHGALTPLVGCEEYGCAHPRPADVMEALDNLSTD